MVDYTANQASLSENPTVIQSEPIADGDCVVKATNRVAKSAYTSNDNLHKAKAEKNDEFYTRLEDIEVELNHYRKHFVGKVVLCNCDDPEHSNFFRYFALNFVQLGLKKLIATHYEPNGKSYALIANRELGVDDNGKIDLEGSVRVPFEGDGDFRSDECRAYLDEADVVVTNIPFSLAREYLKVMKDSKKKFIFIGNRNMITYKEFFAEIKANRMWLGVSPMSCTWFEVPQLPEYKKEGNRFKIENGKWYRSLGNACWYTNLQHDKRNTPLDLVGNTYTPEKYPKYDNYDAIEVSKVSEIPDGYKGAMGVPITFLDKYCPEQFEIVKFRKGDDDKDLSVNGKCPYFRILIKAKSANNRVCPHCGGPVTDSEIGDYRWQCLKCDEDFYDFECQPKD